MATIVIGGDRGLCGGYNTNAIRMAERNQAAQRAEGQTTKLVVVGKKIESYFRFRGFEIDDSFTGFVDEPTYEDARAIAAAVVPKFEDGTYDRVDIVYTQFLSAGTQQVVTRQFLPLDTVVLDDAAEPTVPPPTTSSSPAPTSSSNACCPATPRPACSPPCSRARPRSSPPSSGP